MTDSETKYAIRMILISTSLGGMSYLSFNNGLLLAYFSYLGIPSANHSNPACTPAIISICLYDSIQLFI